MFQPIWDVWNAKTPDEQVADGLISDEKYVESLEALSDDELGRISFEFFGMNLDSVGLIRLRLGEHVPHTWDVAVSIDPAATLPQDAVTLLIDNVPQFLAPRLGQPPAEAFRIRIVTHRSGPRLPADRGGVDHHAGLAGRRRRGRQRGPHARRGPAPPGLRPAGPRAHPGRGRRRTPRTSTGCAPVFPASERSWPGRGQDSDCADFRQRLVTKASAYSTPTTTSRNR